LARFARNPDTGEGIPADMLRRLQAAESLGRASRWLRQVALSTISLEMYDRDPNGIDPSATFRTGWDRYYPLPLETGYHMEASFGHLIGYSAYYYTYVWSAVIARDLLRPFREKGTLTDRALAEKYAAEILAPGSCRPAKDLIRAFLGRDFDFAAFEAWIAEGVQSRSGNETRSGP
jgi:thimet oligopeptidase